jgi:hypothetical protein
MQIDCDFPGGNIILESIEGDTINVRQDLRDTEGIWFWFYFRIRGAEGRRITVNFTNKKIIGVRGPACTFDGGGSWKWLGLEAVTNYISFVCDIPLNATDTRFAFAVPYTEENLKNFLARVEGKRMVEKGVLCKTRKGREVEMLRLGCLERPKYRVLLTARHHACESVPNFVMEGMMEFIWGSEPEAIWLREHVEFVLVPFVDKDGVEDGDQGKRRKPHDHNRDYGEGSIYPEVIALKAKVNDWSGGKLYLTFDLHCPHIRGDANEAIYFVGGKNEQNWSRTIEFSKLLASIQQGSLNHQTEDNIPYGEKWNTSVGPLKGCKRWLEDVAGVYMASTIEIPYANARGSVVTPESARSFGRDLVRAIAAQLKC